MALRQPPPPKSSRPTSLTNPYKLPHKTNKAPTKRLKRESKHATLLSRLSKPTSTSKIKKRRRPSKKLVTNLDSLASALPETPAASRTNNTENGEERIAKIKHKSLKSRPGGRKKKEKLVAMEMERFKANMALMATGSTSQRNRGVDGTGEGEEGSEKTGGNAERWAAIRGFISQTMEKRGEGEVSLGKG